MPGPPPPAIPGSWAEDIEPGKPAPAARRPAAGLGPVKPGLIAGEPAWHGSGRRPVHVLVWEAAEAQGWLASESSVIAARTRSLSQYCLNQYCFNSRRRSSFTAETVGRVRRSKLGLPVHRLQQSPPNASLAG